MTGFSTDPQNSFLRPCDLDDVQLEHKSPCGTAMSKDRGRKYHSGRPEAHGQLPPFHFTELNLQEPCIGLTFRDTEITQFYSQLISTRCRLPDTPDLSQNSSMVKWSIYGPAKAKPRSVYAGAACSDALASCPGGHIVPSIRNARA